MLGIEKPWKVLTKEINFILIKLLSMGDEIIWVRCWDDTCYGFVQSSLCQEFFFFLNCMYFDILIKKQLIKLHYKV